jgi:hypothetical protein
MTRHDPLAGLTPEQRRAIQEHNAREVARVAPPTPEVLAEVAHLLRPAVRAKVARETQRRRRSHAPTH